MNCLECQDLLQRRLDGETLEAPGLESHLADCAACREQHHAAQRMMDSLRSRNFLAPSENLSRRIVASVLHDRQKRQLRLRRQLYVTLALAASIVLMILAGNLWLPNANQPPDPGLITPVVKGKDLPVKEKETSPEATSLGSIFEEGGKAFSSIPTLVAEKTREPVKLFANLIPPMASVPTMEDPLEPAAHSLRQTTQGMGETTQGMGEGLQTVADRTRQALSYFAKLSPLDAGPAN